MKVLFAIGNPSIAQFRNTRHNVGKILIQQYLMKLPQFKVKSQKIYPKFTLHQISQKLSFCLSNTYMNNSGKAIQSLLAKYSSIKVQNILILHDDLERKLGNVRIKKEGSSEGHNGISSIIQYLRHNKISRLQIGIGRPEQRDPSIISQYVLSNFKPNQLKIIGQSFKKCLLLLQSQKFV